MKKTILRSTLFVAISIVAGICATKTYKITTILKSNLLLQDIEALTFCETIDGMENDGHCVQDKYLNYFCAEPKFLQRKDCRQIK